MATSSQRLRWLLGTTAALAIALGLVYRWRDAGAPASTPPQLEEAPHREAPSRPPAATAPAPAPAPIAAPQGTPPGAPELPPNVSPTPSEDDLAIPPEAPQTAEWKQGKTELILDSLGKRVQRLEKEIQEAEARGDQETAKRQRILLDRSRRRIAELKADGGGR